MVEHLDLGSGAWVDVVRGLVSQADTVHDELAAGVTWTQGRVFRYERWIPEPRLSGQFRRSGAHPALAEAQRWIERRYRVAFDGVALARYRDGRDSVAWHRDRELRWLEETVIGVLSLGARRPFLLRPLTGRRMEADDPTGVIDLSPGSGDLLVMGGRCQAAWLHAVPKLPRAAAGPEPHLGAVALDVAPRPARHERLLLRAPPLRAGDCSQRLTAVDARAARPR